MWVLTYTFFTQFFQRIFLHTHTFFFAEPESGSTYRFYFFPPQSVRIDVVAAATTSGDVRLVCSHRWTLLYRQSKTGKRSHDRDPENPCFLSTLVTGLISLKAPGWTLALLNSCFLRNFLSAGERRETAGWTRTAGNQAREPGDSLFETSNEQLVMKLKNS